MTVQLSLETKLQGGKYVIKKVLGQGGFGITYLAEQSLLKIKVAIKEFFIRDLCDRDDTACVRTITQAAMVGRYRQKFFKEAQILARLNHPGLVRVTDIFEENGTVYYVMDYVEGESLDEIVKRSGYLTEEKALHYISKVSEALDYIHQSNVNHLDIKPANIMIRRDDDEPILIDFGVSKQYDEQKDQTTTTPPGVSNGYSPLEQYKPGGVSTFSPQADIYALGATLYHLLTGSTPPNASDMLNDGLPSMPDTISPHVRHALVKAMQPRKDDRPKSVREWMQMMVGEVSEETIIQPTAVASTNLKDTPDMSSYNQQSIRPSKRKRPLWIFLVLLALFAIGVCLWVLKDNGKPEHVVVDATNKDTIDAGLSPSDDTIHETIDDTIHETTDETTHETIDETIEQSSYDAGQISDELYNLLVEKIDQWDKGHKLGETYWLYPLYANHVFFYGEMRSQEKVFEIIDETLNKTDGFAQNSSNFNMLRLSDNSVRCDFDKHTYNSNGRVGYYPSYLRFEKIDGDWVIVEESDVITDRNLRKRRRGTN